MTNFCCSLLCLLAKSGPIGTNRGRGGGLTGKGGVNVVEEGSTGIGEGIRVSVRVKKVTDSMEETAGSSVQHHLYQSQSRKWKVSVRGTR